MKILDGLGRGYEAGVNNRGMLIVEAITREQAKDGAFHARAYAVGSGIINLTSANESAVFYIRNDHTLDWLQMEVGGVGTGLSTNGTGSYKLRGYANPATGSIFTSGSLAVTGSTGSNAPYACNANLSSRAIPQLTIRGGGEGQTQTGGTGLFSSRLSPPGTDIDIISAIVMGPGASVVFTLQPPTNNASMSASMHCVVNFVSTLEVP